MENEKLIKYVAQENKIFKSKKEGLYLSNILYLGIEDSIDNYEEVDEEELFLDDEEDPG